MQAIVSVGSYLVMLERDDAAVVRNVVVTQIQVPELWELDRTREVVERPEAVVRQRELFKTRKLREPECGRDAELSIQDKVTRVNQLVRACFKI